MNLREQTARVTGYRQSLYDTFSHCADVLMNVIDALSSNTTARSVVELSLNPAFERGYSALFKGIASLSKPDQSHICQPHRAEEAQASPQAKLDQSQTDTASYASQKPEPTHNPAMMQQPTQQPGINQFASAVQPGCSKLATNQPAADHPNHQVLEQLIKSPPVNQLPQPTTATDQHTHTKDAIESQQASPPPPPTTATDEHTHTKDAIESQQASQQPQQTAADQPIVATSSARIAFEKQIQSLVVPYLPSLQKRSFHLFAIDVTSQPRQFSPTLQDRGFVYQPNAIKGNKPVTIGHQYSVLAYLPQKGKSQAPWVVPLSTRRVRSSDDKELIGLEQIEALICNQSFDFHDQLSVQVVDCSYSKREFLYQSAKKPNLVTIARVRSDRTFYQKYQAPEVGAPKAGRPTWYGKRFSLKEPDSWHEPDQDLIKSFVSRRGKQYEVKMQAWQNMLMRGKDGIAMHQVPFTLVRMCFFKPNGERAFKNDLWLIVVGKRRDEISLDDVYEAYPQRFDIEHYFRRMQQKLLMTAFQTPEVEREENWWQIVQLAYTQLWLAAPLARHLPRPWEKYLPRPEGQIPSPSMVQRDFGRIIRQLGTPANPPKVRHKGTGRRKGQTVPPRECHPVVKKGTKSQLKKAA